jgi:hypothetical protein
MGVLGRWRRSLGGSLASSSEVAACRRLVQQVTSGKLARRSIDGRAGKLRARVSGMLCEAQLQQRGCGARAAPRAGFRNQKLAPPAREM